MSNEHPLSNASDQLGPNRWPATNAAHRIIREFTPQELERYKQAVAEEMAAKPANIAAARETMQRLKEERQPAAELLRRLKAAREAAGLSLDDLAGRTGLDRESLANLENNSAPDPSVATLRRYAAALGLELTWRLR